MIQIEPCKGCGRPLFTLKVANLDVRCETEALDAQEAVAELLAGRNLWRATATSLAGVRPAELEALRLRGQTEGPHIVRTHRCTATGRPATPTPRPSPQPTPSVPPAGRTAPFSGPLAANCSVPGAANHPSRGQGGLQEPVCGLCGNRPDPGTYWGFQHGDRWVYAEHADACPTA